MSQKINKNRSRRKSRHKPKKENKEDLLILESHPLSQKIRSLKIFAYVLVFGHILLSTTFKLFLAFNSPEKFYGFFTLKSLFYAATVAIPAAAILISITVGLKKVTRFDPKEIYKRLKYVVILQSVMVSVILILLLHLGGFTSYLTNVIYASAPALGLSISKIFSTLASWIISGIIGNFAYDYLKRKILKRVEK